MLGRLIETVTGTTWENAMRRLLFEQADMAETDFATSSPTARQVSGHELTASGPVPVKPLTARGYGPAGSTAVSTVIDLLRFAALQLRQDHLAGLRVVHAVVAIHGWFDAWCLGLALFDWHGGQAWGAGTAWSPASGRCCGSCRTTGRPSR